MSERVSEAEFLQQQSVPVYNLALRLVGNAADAEDLAQDALLRAIKALPAFRGDSALSTWVYRITVNTWKNRVRSEKRRGLWKMLPLSIFSGGDEEEDGRVDESSLKADEPALDAGLESDERGQAVQKALLELDEDSRAIVVLREIHGQSYQEIASALEIPEGTVKSRLSRARDALKARLQKLVTP
mgnify:CR=1 FL=1